VLTTDEAAVLCRQHLAAPLQIVQVPAPSTYWACRQPKERHVFFSCLETDSWRVGGVRTVAVSMDDGHIHELGLVGE